MSRILSRRVVFDGGWVQLLEKDVRVDEGRVDQYYCLTQSPYVTVVALTSDGRIPLVRQYRPTVEAETWELPSGTLDAGDTPEQAAARELVEETGLTAGRLQWMGQHYPDTGRLDVPLHAMFATVDAGVPAREPEAGMAVRLVTPEEFMAMVRRGEFRMQIHVGVFFTAAVHGLLPLPAFERGR